IIKYRASGKSGPLVLVGHSQGGNNVIEMARLLEREKIRVDLLITLAPFGQDPIPGNVVRATNYYHSPGWGMPLAADAGYRGKLSNINLGGDSGISHIAIDKSPKIQAEIERAICRNHVPAENVCNTEARRRPYEDHHQLARSHA